MTHFLATLHVYGLDLVEHAQSHAQPPARSRGGRDERGSVTIEQVLWAVAMIAIVGIVVAAIRAYVTTQAGNIK